MPVRRKSSEPQTPPTTPRKTRSKRNGSNSSASSQGSQKYTALLVERPTSYSQPSLVGENPFSKAEEIFKQLQLKGLQPKILNPKDDLNNNNNYYDNNNNNIDDNIVNDFTNQSVPNLPKDRGIINDTQQNNNNNSRGFLKNSLNFFIDLLAKSLNLIGFTIFFIFWSIKNFSDFVWKNLTGNENGPFINLNNNNNNNNNRSNKSRWFFYLICFIILFLLLSNIKFGQENKTFLDYFPSAKIHIWAIDSKTYKIQPIGEKKNDGIDNKNDSIILTYEDFQQMIIAEVRNHLNSEDGKRSPTSLPTELHSMIVSEVKQITENEFKNIVTSEVKKASLRAPPARYRGSLRGEEMLEIIRTEARQIAKEELLKYSQDKLSVPDFALHSGGAKIISKYTSKTYERWPDKWYKQTFAYLSGQGILRGKPPVTAISHDTNVGQCWPFSGQEGQLAILLNRRVHVTSVTYDHVSKDIAVEIQSAPKDFEVWGIIDDGVGGKDNQDDDEEYDIDNSMRNYMDTNEDYDRMESTEDSCGVRVDGQYEPGKGNNQLPDSDHSSDDGLSHLKRQFDNLTYGELRLGSSPLHLYLGKFTYDMHGLPVQTFDIPKHITAHNKPIRAIIMKVKSNWGKPEYTCLYRFRVHGTPA